MDSNIRLFYVYIFLNRLEMWLPVTVLFVTGRGVSLAQYTILDAVWYASTLAFEVPTGAVTDRYGKKISLLIAALLQSLSLFILAFGNTFLAMLISYVLWGFGASFETGTNDAFIYDSLKQMDKEGDYRKVRGRIADVASLQTTFKVLGLGMLVGMSLVLPPLRTEVTN
jgi:MFS family permease